MQKASHAQEDAVQAEPGRPSRAVKRGHRLSSLPPPQAPTPSSRIEVDRYTEALSRLVTAVKELSLATSIEEIARVVRSAARSLNGADGATFVLNDGGDLCHYFDEDAIAPLWKGKKFPQETCISGWAMRNRTHASIPDIYEDPRIPADAYRPTFVKSLVMVPVRKEAPVAAIGNYWATPHTPTEREIELIQALADSTSVAMERVKVYEELEKRARERTRALETANRELDAFAYSVSHDLRTPLGQIMGFASLLQEELPGDLPIGMATYVEHILAAGRRMNGLIDDLLRLGRISKAEVSLTTVDVGAMARDVLEVLRANDPRRHVDVVIEPDLKVEADPSLLRVALENLLSNAWKYTGKVAAPRITVGALRPEAGARSFFVRDNGAGFDPALVGRLFTPFSRLHSADDFPGNGVGLATCRRVLVKHGGRIWAESERGRGATFFFSLPSAGR